MPPKPARYLWTVPRLLPKLLPDNLIDHVLFLPFLAAFLGRPLDPVLQHNPEWSVLLELWYQTIAPVAWKYLEEDDEYDWTVLIELAEDEEGETTGWKGDLRIAAMKATAGMIIERWRCILLLHKARTAYLCHMRSQHLGSDDAALIAAAPVGELSLAPTIPQHSIFPLLTHHPDPSRKQHPSFRQLSRSSRHPDCTLPEADVSAADTSATPTDWDAVAAQMLRTPRDIYVAFSDPHSPLLPPTQTTSPDAVRRRTPGRDQ